MRRSWPLTLVTGSLWGRLTWGVFWQWDARLTTTALLFVSYIGYLAVRGLGGSHHQRAKRSAVVGLLAVLEIPLVHWWVRLWRSLHQEASVLDTDGDIDMDGLMLFSLFVGVVAFTLLYVWLVMHRSRAMAMEDLLDDHGLDVALADRRAEADGGHGRSGAAMEDAGFIIGSYVDHVRSSVGAARLARSSAAGRQLVARRSPTTTSTGPDR